MCIKAQQLVCAMYSGGWGYIVLSRLFCNDVTVCVQLDESYWLNVYVIQSWDNLHHICRAIVCRNIIFSLMQDYWLIHQWYDLHLYYSVNINPSLSAVMTMMCFHQPMVHLPNTRLLCRWPHGMTECDVHECVDFKISTPHNHLPNCSDFVE